MKTRLKCCKTAHRDQKAHKSSGFSLLEVLVALFIVATVIAMATKVASNSVRNARLMKESTFAQWVALNELDRYQIKLASGQREGYGEGEAEMGDMTWRWVREIKPSNSSDLVAVTVSVYHDDDLAEEEPVAAAKVYVPSQ